MLVFVNHDDMRSLELMEEMLHRGYYVSDQFKDMKYADVIYMGMRGIDRKIVYRHIKKQLLLMRTCWLLLNLIV